MKENRLFTQRAVTYNVTNCGVWKQFTEIAFRSSQYHSHLTKHLIRYVAQSCFIVNNMFPDSVLGKFILPYRVTKLALNFDKILK
jgi:hypothetical protein